MPATASRSCRPPRPCEPDDLERLVAVLRAPRASRQGCPHAHATTGYIAGPAADRAADLMQAFADPDIQLVMPAEGGEGAANLLELLDFDVIGESGKVFVGLSDTSILANAIATRAGLAALHGPTGHSFSRLEVEPYTEDWFWRIVSCPVAGQEVAGDTWRVPQGAGQVGLGPCRRRPSADDSRRWSVPRGCRISAARSSSSRRSTSPGPRSTAPSPICGSPASSTRSLRCSSAPLATASAATPPTEAGRS